MVHKRNICPTRKVAYNNCGKIGHHSKVCKSESGKSLMATIYKLTLSNIMVTIPESISQASTNVFINKHKLIVPLDSNSPVSFINEIIASKLNLKIEPQNQEISMALTNINTQTYGFCFIELKLNNIHYMSANLKVLKDLYSDLIIGQDSQREHNLFRKNTDLKLTL